MAKNRNLELYVAATREVADKHGVVMADVFHQTRELGDAARPGRLRDRRRAGT